MVAEHRVVIRIAGEEEAEESVLARGQPETGSTAVYKKQREEEPTHEFQSLEPRSLEVRET